MKTIVITGVTRTPAEGWPIKAGHSELLILVDSLSLVKQAGKQ